MNSAAVLAFRAQQLGNVRDADLQAAGVLAEQLRTPTGDVATLAAQIDGLVPGAWDLLQQAGLERIAQNARGEVLDNVMPAHDRSVELTPTGVVLDGVADPAALEVASMVAESEVSRAPSA